MRKYIFILCILCMMLCVACGKNENDSELITKEAESMRTIDAQAMFEKIEIGGKAVGFPFILKELPENYIVEEPEDDKPKEYPLFVDGKREIGVLIGVDFESRDKFYDGTVNHIFWSVPDTEKLEESKGKISIDDITIGSTMDEVIDKFGEPSEKYIGDNNGQEYRSYRYYGKKNEFITFNAEDGKHINCITVDSEQ